MEKMPPPDWSVSRSIRIFLVGGCCGRIYLTVKSNTPGLVVVGAIEAD